MYRACLLFLFNLLAVACIGEGTLAVSCLPPIGGVLVPQATRAMYEPPATLPAGTVHATPMATEDASLYASYCTPSAPALPVSSGAGRVRAGSVRNVTLDLADNQLIGTAIGNSQTAVIWQEDDHLVLATMTESGQSEQTVLGEGETADLIYAPNDQLHIVVEQENKVSYMLTDPNETTSSALTREVIEQGTKPYIQLNSAGWPVVTYSCSDEQGLCLTNLTPTGWVTARTNLSGEVVQFSIKEESLFLLVKESDKQLSLFRTTQDSPENWQLVQDWQAAHKIWGSPTFTMENDTIVVAWITQEPVVSTPDEWPRFRPEYKPAAPWQNRIHAGSNAQQYFTRFAVHEAGLYQQFSTTGPIISATAFGQVWSTDEPCTPAATSCTPTDMRLQIGIDPTGDTDAFSRNIQWSGAVSPTDSYTQLTITAVSQGPTATLFLKSHPKEPRSHNDVYWDSVTVSGGELLNGGFDEGFGAASGINELQMAAGWTPWYVEDKLEEETIENHYTIFSSFLHNGRWYAPFPITHNKLANKWSGSLLKDVYPVILENYSPLRVTYIFGYEAGDPASDQPDALRVGRPHTATCVLLHYHCTDAPGTSLLPITAVSPTTKLALEYANGAGVLAFSALQADGEAQDIYLTRLTGGE